MVITDCYKICVFCFENKHVGPALYCCHGGDFYFWESYIFLNFPLGNSNPDGGHQKVIIQPNVDFFFLPRVG